MLDPKAGEKGLPMRHSSESGVEKKRISGKKQRSRLSR